jgi:HNH endonuclease
MSGTYISAAMRRKVIARAHGCCEYCGIPEGMTLAPHEPDHVIGEQHGGSTGLDNLACACFRCNRFKGPNIATLDPQTGALTPLFNPRADHWSEHFRLDEAVIEPLTPVGRGTAMFLRLNDEQRIALRAELIRQGRYSAPLS